MQYNQIDGGFITKHGEMHFKNLAVKYDAHADRRYEMFFGHREKRLKQKKNMIIM